MQSMCKSWRECRLRYAWPADFRVYRLRINSCRPDNQARQSGQPDQAGRGRCPCRSAVDNAASGTDMASPSTRGVKGSGASLAIGAGGASTMARGSCPSDVASSARPSPLRAPPLSGLGATPSWANGSEGSLGAGSETGTKATDAASVARKTRPRPVRPTRMRSMGQAISIGRLTCRVAATAASAAPSWPAIPGSRWWTDSGCRCRTRW